MKIKPNIPKLKDRGQCTPPTLSSHAEWVLLKCRE